MLIAILIREEAPKSLSVKGDEKQKKHCELAWKPFGRQTGRGKDFVTSSTLEIEF